MSTPTTPVNPTMSVDQLLARIAQLEQDKKDLARKAAGKLTIKIGNKGTISVYGLRRFPVSFYAAEWEKLEAVMPTLKRFIADNADAIAERVKNPLIVEEDGE